MGGSAEGWPSPILFQKNPDCQVARGQTNKQPPSPEPLNRPRAIQSVATVQVPLFSLVGWPEKSTCRRSALAFAFPIAFPILLLAGGAVGLFVAGGRPTVEPLTPSLLCCHLHIQCASFGHSKHHTQERLTFTVKKVPRGRVVWGVPQT